MLFWVRHRERRYCFSVLPGLCVLTCLSEDPSLKPDLIFLAIQQLEWWGLLLESIKSNFCDGISYQLVIEIVMISVLLGREETGKWWLGLALMVGL